MPVSCLLYSVLHLSPLSFSRLQPSAFSLVLSPLSFSLQPSVFSLSPSALFLSPFSLFIRFRIKDLEKEIYVEEGKTLKVGLFKGSALDLLPSVYISIVNQQGAQVGGEV